MKKLVITCLCICIVVSLALLPASAMDRSLDMKTKMIEQRDAVMVNELLYDTFQLTTDGYLYPDNFAGTYVDDGILYILWTVLSEQQKLFYDKLFADYENCYEYRFVEYSYNELQTLGADTYNKLKNDLEIVRYGVDVLSNRAVIGVFEGDYRNLNKYSQSINREVPAAVYYVAESRPISTSVLMGGSPCHDANDIDNKFTLGICGTYDGENAAITCGHGLDVGITVTCLSTDIGEIEYRTTNYGDYSIILTNDDAQLTNRVKTGGNSYVEIGGTIKNPPVGSIVCKYGRATGYSEYGEIRDTGSTVTFGNTGLTIRELTTVYWDECASELGDSGGPYFMEDYGIPVFCGVHSGHAGDGTVTYFTPYYFPYAAGFDAMVE